MGYRRLQQGTEWFQWGTAGYSRLPSGCSGLQRVTTRYPVAIVGYSSLQQVTEWLQWVTADKQQFTNWLHWVTAG